MGLHLEITGLEALRQRLVPGDFRAVLVQAIRSALQPVRSAIAGVAPRGKTGKLASSITTRVGGRGAGIQAAIVAGTGYGHLVEYGHRMVIGGRVQRQTLRSARGALKPQATSGRFAGRVVGQVAPHPFARPTFAAMAGQFSADVEAQLIAQLNGA